MGDFKSKLPTLQEIAGIADKLYSDLKKSISEIICDYQKNHQTTPPDGPDSTTVKSDPMKPKKSKKNTPHSAKQSDVITSAQPEKKPKIDEENHIDEKKPLNDDVL